jgi:hypothetical protein
MKRIMAILFALVLGFSLLSSPSISEARGGHGRGGGHVGSGWAGAGHYGGYRGGYYGGYRGWYYGRFYGRGFYPYWGLYGWGYWGWPLLGWAYAGWPYYAYAGYPYLGWPYYSPYYSSDVATAPPVYNEPEQPQSQYWYYCTNPQGYYPYIRSCPGGWLTVVPNVTPPSPPPAFTPPPSGVNPPPATGQPGTGNISPPPTTSQITPNPNQKRCQKWAPTGEYHNETRWNAEKQTMETVSVPNFAWQDIPCE